MNIIVTNGQYDRGALKLFLHCKMYHNDIERIKTTPNSLVYDYFTVGSVLENSLQLRFNNLCFSTS